MADSDLTAARLRELLHYDPETGEFIWAVRRGPMRAGSVAGRINEWGHRRINLCGSMVMAHRLAWFLCSGAWPSQHIDHINGNHDDNRIANLRDVSASVNAQNRRAVRSNGRLAGAQYHKANRKWVAAVQDKSLGRQRYLGSFDTAEQAHAAYIEAKRRLHPGCTI